ncbi:hypothetical protein BJ508DRAFT_418587 [Ascobolus immersus RN42]|uniref:Helitron helicase-like domain-containing protein n=1 Tax=Ascobolus immersus RN42 TaxID=1160509 RepID=A0A3N4HL01_ASCIM|nr:hypothetical protein BJ508DRAFT_418587 [Ascobolus immersus RN42]
MRWFLYDQQDQMLAAEERQIPELYVRAFKRLLEQVNPFVHHLRHAAQQLNAETAFAIELRDPGPTGGDIAAIIHTDNRLRIENRSIVVWNRSGSTSRKVNILNRHYESLQYPVLFPHGTDGWSPARNVSQIWWYRMRILREPRFHLFSRLFNEYVVDMYSRVEDERIHYYRNGRMFQLDEMRQRMAEQDINDTQNVDGQPVNEANCSLAENAFIFPSGFMGSKAWASEQVADALAICRDLGPPSLFITITTNPNWPEIVERLQPGMTCSDIPNKGY